MFSRGSRFVVGSLRSRALLNSSSLVCVRPRALRGITANSETPSWKIWNVRESEPHPSFAARACIFWLYAFALCSISRRCTLEVDGELTRRQVRLLKGQIDDRRFDLVRDLVPDPPRSRLAILQSFDPTLLVSAVPLVERRSRDPDWSQCPALRATTVPPVR